mgnify:CR=1 FL=1
MNYGLHVGNGFCVTDPSVLRDVAQMAEELGYESILIGDHVLPPQKINSPFPLPVENPRLDMYEKQTWPDCFVMLGFMAAATTRVRLGTSVVILPYRHPVVMAKMIATLDRLSNGRVICGVGVGWIEEEFAFLNVPFSERGRMSNEYIEIMKALWTEDHPRIDGRYVKIDRDVNFGPMPVHKPHPPIWIGGNSTAALRRVVRLGDGWQPAGIIPDVMQRKMDQLKGLMDEADRDWGELEITAMVPATARPETAQVFEKMGVNVLYGLVSATDTETPKLFSEIKKFAVAMSGRAT